MEAQTGSQPATPTDSPAPSKSRLWSKVRDAVISDIELSTPTEAVAPADDGYVEQAPSWVWQPETLIPVMHPDGKARFHWDIVQCVSLVWVSIFVPLRLGFDWPAVGTWFICDCAIDLYFIFDFCLGFFTAVHLHDDTRVEEDEEDYFQHNGHYVIVDKARIALHYLKGWFGIDLFASLPIEFFMRLEQGSLGCSLRVTNPCSVETHSSGAAVKLVKILRLFRILKLFRLLKLKKLFTRYQDDFVYLMPVISATKLVFAMLWMSHWMGCTYALVFPFEEQEKPMTTLSSKYIGAMYWAMQTITTVGYGDMVGTTDGARVVATAGMAIGGLIFGWLIQYVISVLDPDTFERKQQARIDRMMAYLRANRLPPQLSARVVRHVRQQNSRQTEDRAVLTELPRQLRSDICLHLYESFMLSVPLFSHAANTYTHHAFVSDVCTKVVPLTIPVSEMVYGAGDVAEEGAYLIVTGAVQLLSPAAPSRKHMRRLAAAQDHATSARAKRATAEGGLEKELGPGDVFGESSALGSTRRFDEAVARKTSELLTISGPDLRCALDLAPRLRWTVLQRTVEHAIKCIHDPRLLMVVLRELHLPELLEEDTKGIPARFEDSIRILRHHKVYKVVPNWREALYNIREDWEGRVCSTPQHSAAPTSPRRERQNFFSSTGQTGLDVHEELKLVRRDLSDLTDAVRGLFATRAFDHADFHKMGGALHGVVLAARETAAGQQPAEHRSEEQGSSVK